MKELVKNFFSVEKIRSRVAIVITLICVTRAIDAHVQYMVAQVINKIAGKTDYTQLLAILILELIIATILEYAICRVRKEILPRYITGMSVRVAKKALAIDYAHYSAMGEGYVQRIFQLIPTIGSGGMSLLTLVGAIITFTSLAISIILIDARLLLPIMVIYGVAAIILRQLFRKISSINDKIEDAMEIRSNQIALISDGFAEIRAVNAEREQLEQIQKSATEVFELSIKRSKLMGLSWLSFAGFDALVTLAGITLAIVAIPTGLLSATAMVIISYARSLLDPIINGIDMLDIISEAKAQYKKMKEFFALSETIQSGKMSMPHFRKEIVMRDVNFSYNSSENTIHNFSLCIKKGEKIGIVGSSGCGKTTVLKLLQRFYDSTGGEIQIDGIDIKGIAFESLRKLVGSVQQETYIFKGTLWDNITYGVKYPTEYEVIEACKNASIYDFIMNLPDKFQTNVGARGLKLSGGQKQRIAVARLFLRNPEIVLLDEATSALDNEAEAGIQESLKRLEGKTIITVAHRLTTVKDCDRIIVMDGGEIVEEGTHEDLMSKGGVYFKLYTAKD